MNLLSITSILIPFLFKTCYQVAATYSYATPTLLTDSATFSFSQNDAVGWRWSHRGLAEVSTSVQPICLMLAEWLV